MKTSILIAGLVAIGVLGSTLAQPAASGPNFDDITEAAAAISRQRDQQHARCEMDASQYVDEHPDLASIAGEKLQERYQLCMRAAGWPILQDGFFAINADRYRRIREMWEAQGKSQEWFKLLDDHRAFMRSKYPDQY